MLITPGELISLWLWFNVCLITSWIDSWGNNCPLLIETDPDHLHPLLREQWLSSLIPMRFIVYFEFSHIISLVCGSVPVQTSGVTPGDIRFVTLSNVGSGVNVTLFPDLSLFSFFWAHSLAELLWKVRRGIRKLGKYTCLHTALCTHTHTHTHSDSAIPNLENVLDDTEVTTHELMRQLTSQQVSLSHLPLSKHNKGTMPSF